MAPDDDATRMYREAAQAADAIEVQFARNEAAVAALAARLRRRSPRFVVTFIGGVRSAA